MSKINPYRDCVVDGSAFIREVSEEDEDEEEEEDEADKGDEKDSGDQEDEGGYSV